jgi:hypothetical protein
MTELRAATLLVLAGAFLAGQGAQAAPLLPAAPKALAGPPRVRAGGKVVNAARLAPLVKMVLKDGMDDISYKGGIAAVLGIPDPTKTKTELRSARKTTDGWRHLCSVTLVPSPAGKPEPGEVVFWANRKVGRGNEDFYARVSLDGFLLKAIVREDLSDERGYVVRGAAEPMALEVRSQEAQERVRHELELWLFGDSLKPKDSKKHLKKLAKFGKPTPALKAVPAEED